MRKSIIGYAMGAFMGFGLMCQAQVQYKIEWKAEEQAFQVSLVPQTTWEGPQGITASGQVSIKAPAGMLDVTNFRSLQNGVNWEFNAEFKSPQEAESFDYFSFGLTTLGTSGIRYVAGQEIPVFSFQNGLDCAGKVELVDNEADAFMPPNTAKANIGNQLTVFGAGGNAYAGNVGLGSAVCEFASNTTDKQPSKTHFTVYPTKAESQVNVAFDALEADATAEFNIMDASGKAINRQKHEVQKGSNLIVLDITSLRAGTYTIELRSKDSSTTVGRVIKPGI